jgi:hypothetical protein
MYYLGGQYVGYKLTMREHYNSTCSAKSGVRHLAKWYAHPEVVLFEGEDFRCSPLHGQDSDEAVKSLMNFLTCRPGDTDAEYFAKYTELQLDYCSQHAEVLSCEVSNRFGE